VPGRRSVSTLIFDITTSDGINNACMPPAVALLTSVFCLFVASRGMDARRGGLGIVMTMPVSQVSLLGDVIYIDDSGSPVKVANIFESNHPKLSTFGYTKEECIVRKTLFKGIVEVATPGIKLTRLEEIEDARFVTSWFCAESCSGPVSVTKSEDGAWVIVDTKILCQYRVVDEFRSKTGHLVLLGPFLAKRSLDIDETHVQEWINKNKDILNSMRASSINKRYPKMIVVLSEWTSNTWTHISWNRKEDRPYSLDLIQQSPQAAPQWNYSFSYHKGSMTHMTGNRTVSIGSKIPFLLMCFRNERLGEWR